MRRCMECLDFTQTPLLSFFFCNLYACSDSFTPHRKRLSENHAPCNRAYDFSSLSTYPRGLECLTICKSEAKTAASQLFYIQDPAEHLSCGGLKQTGVYRFEVWYLLR